ncbi:hypothetical protein AOLI_G00302580 [Acnodon oligacanthus]
MHLSQVASLYDHGAILMTKSSVLSDSAEDANGAGCVSVKSSCGVSRGGAACVGCSISPLSLSAQWDHTRSAPYTVTL